MNKVRATCYGLKYFTIGIYWLSLYQQVKQFGTKGRGVVTTRKFKKGEFVVEYIGDLIDVREAKERESRYAQDATKGCYNYYFTFQNQQYW